MKYGIFYKGKDSSFEERLEEIASIHKGSLSNIEFMNGESTALFEFPRDDFFNLFFDDVKRLGKQFSIEVFRLGIHTI